MGNYILPSILDFKAQFRGDFPYAVPLVGGGSGAAVTAVLTGDQITSYTVDAPGSGYPTIPTIIVQYGSGFGALAQATLTTGELATVTPITKGYGYSLTPTPPSIYISNGMGDNTNPNKVSDFDIAYAMNQAFLFNITQALVSSQTAFTNLYNLLAAHYLVRAMTSRVSGLSGKGDWITKSKTVGNVSASYEIPDRILRSPLLSKLSQTTYGANFLELMAPQLVGNFAAFHRCTLP